MNPRTLKTTLLVILALAVWLSAGAALASALEDARAAGTVGERRDGYVGLVAKSPTDAQKAFVADINAQRKAAYAQIAKKTGTSVGAVAKLQAEKLIREQAAKGNYVEGADGGWVRTP